MCVSNVIFFNDNGHIHARNLPIIDVNNNANVSMQEISIFL